MKSSKLPFYGVLLILFWSCSDLGDSEINGPCLQLDCNSECGGDAVIDSCGTCAGIIMNASECECPDGQTKDCTGECGGTAEEDCTGECGGTNQNCVSFSSEIQLIFDNNCTIDLAFYCQLAYLHHQWNFLLRRMWNILFDNYFSLWGMDNFYKKNGWEKTLSSKPLTSKKPFFWWFPHFHLFSFSPHSFFLEYKG